MTTKRKTDVDEEDIKALLPARVYQSLFGNTMGLGGSVDCQRMAALHFADYLEELGGEGDVYDSLVKAFVKESVKNFSYPFLAQLFARFGRDAAGQIIVQDLMGISIGHMSCFIKDLFDLICEEDFELQYASDALWCILLAESVDITVRKCCIEDLLTSTVDREWGMRLYSFDFGQEACILFNDYGLKDALGGEQFDQLEALIIALEEDTDKNKLCHQLAGRLAAHFGKWELLWTIQKREVVPGVDTDTPLFKSAMLSSNFKNVGCMLQNCVNLLSDPDSRLHGDVSLSTMESCVREHFSCQKHKKLLPMLLEECRNNELFGAGTLVAVWTKDLKEAKTLAVCEFKRCGDLKVVLTEIKQHSWGIIPEIVSLLQAGAAKQKMVKHVLKLALNRRDSVEARAVFKRLLTLCSDKSFLVDKVLSKLLNEEHFEIESDLQLFSTFFSEDPIDLSQVLMKSKGPLLSAIVYHLSDSILLQFSLMSGVLPETQKYRVMLKMCIEAGLSAQPSQSTADEHVWYGKNTLKNASRSGDLSLVQLVYRTVPVSSTELHQAIQLVTRAAPGSKRCADVLKYLSMKASRPRSLQKLCTLKVSQHIGCRATRTRSILCLSLPGCLTSKVLFQDALNMIGQIGEK